MESETSQCFWAQAERVRIAKYLLFFMRVISHTVGVTTILAFIIIIIIIQEEWKKNI